MRLSDIVLTALLVLPPLVIVHMLTRKYREDAKILLGARRTMPPVAGAVDDESVSDEVQELLAHGRKADAINVVRQKTRLSLAAATERVEAIERGGAAETGSETLAGRIETARELAPEVQRLVRQGQRLEAVRLVRERTGLGLKEAKELVDRLA